MAARSERYEIYWDDKRIAGGMDVGGLAIDVCPRGEKHVTKKPCLVFMSEDKGEDAKGNELGHTPFGYVEFKNPKNIELAQKALDMLERAIGREQE